MWYVICKVLDVQCVMSDVRCNMLDMRSEIWGVGPNNKLAGPTLIPNKADLQYILCLYNSDSDRNYKSVGFTL